MINQLQWIFGNTVYKQLDNFSFNNYKMSIFFQNG